jgi:hypothetical protein
MADKEIRIYQCRNCRRDPDESPCTWVFPSGWSRDRTTELRCPVGPADNSNWKLVTPIFDNPRHDKENS